MDWSQLVIELEGISWQAVFPLIERAWSMLVGIVGADRELDVVGPDSTPWFHVRRRLFLNDDGRHINSIQIIRLSDVEGPHLRNLLRMAACELPGVTSATWQPLVLGRGDGQAFFSFLQKLSVLRVSKKVCVEGELGRISRGKRHCDCEHCQLAYRTMRQPDSPWSEALQPWFSLMDRTEMDANLTHEYAHWFGHIMSSWT